MPVSHSPAGYVGTVDEIQEARRFGLAAPPFRVASVTDWAPSADTGVNRQVNISAGQAVACGVADITTAPDSVTFAANNGTTNRYDALVATFCWAANSGLGLAAHTVTFRVIGGTTTPPATNAGPTIDNTKINRVRGVQYDALIAVVRVRPGVGLLTSGDVVDSRMWAGFEGYANTGSAQNLTLLDTLFGSLVRAVDTDIVWNRLPGGVWGFEKWAGTDRTKQPMLSGRSTGRSMPHNVSTVCAFTDITDHSGGLLTPGGGSPVTTFTCNAYGGVRVEAHAFSDTTSQGVSDLDLAFPAAGGHYLSTLSDERQRNVGYVGAGTLRQTITAGPIQVAPGDVFSMSIYQFNTATAAVNYDLYLTATYV